MTLLKGPKGEEGEPGRQGPAGQQGDIGPPGQRVRMEGQNVKKGCGRGFLEGDQNCYIKLHPIISIYKVRLS